MKTLSEKIDLEKPMYIESNKACISGDFHIPFQDDLLIEKMINRCQDEKIKTIIVNGDFLDCKNISNFIDLQQTELTFQNELNEANRILRLLCRNFENVYFINSNHEARFSRKMEGNCDIRDLYRMFSGNLKEGRDYNISIYDFCILNDKWYICHPNFFSTIPLSIPRTLATKYHMNIAVGHLHRLSMGKDISGKFFTLETGGMFDAEKLEYLKQTSKNPVQTSGYVIIENDSLSLFSGK